MRNTKRNGVFHFRIFKCRGRFLGICKEAGFVEEAEDLESVKNKLINGYTILLEAVNKCKEQDLEPSLNTNPPFKYRMYYEIAPLLSNYHNYTQPYHFECCSNPIF